MAEMEEDFEFRSGSIMDAFKMNTSKTAPVNQLPGDDIEEEQEEVTDTDSEEEVTQEVEEPNKEIEEETEEEVSNTDVDTEDSEDITFSPLASYLAEIEALKVDPNKEYEDSPEGLAEMIRDTVEIEREQWLDSLGDDAKDVLRFISNGGAIKDYIEFERSNSYADLDMEDVDNQIRLVKEHMALTGMEEADIEDYVRDLEDSGILERHAMKAQKYLEKRHEELRTKMIAEQEEARIAEEQEYKRQQKEFVDTIMNGKIGNFEIPKTERKKFLDYLTKPVTNDGKSQYQVDDNYDDRIKLAYFKFKQFDFTDIERQARTKAVIDIKKGMSRYTDSMAKSSTNRVDEDTTRESKHDKVKLNVPWLGARMTE